MFLHFNNQEVKQLNIKIDPSPIDGSSNQGHYIIELIRITL